MSRFKAVAQPVGQPALVVQFTPEEEAAFDVSEAAAAAAQIAKDAETARLEAIRTEPNRAALVNAIKNATAAEIGTYVDAQVTDLASARLMLKRILLLVSYSIRN